MRIVNFLKVLTQDQLIRIEGDYPTEFKIFPTWKLRYTANGYEPVNNLSLPDGFGNFVIKLYRSHVYVVFAL